MQLQQHISFLILTRFGCPRVLMSDQGTYFLNHSIQALREEFQANGTIGAFNKILEHALTKACNISTDNWDLRILVVLWAYRTTCKKLTRYTPFKLAYGQEVVMLMEYVVPSLRIATLTNMADEETLTERLLHLIGLKEDHFITIFHQQVQKAREKTWHDRHIKHKTFKVGDLSSSMIVSL